MNSVLIVEDDPVMLRGLKDNFARHQYLVHSASDGEDGLEKALAIKPDLIILDIMLPQLNGYQICQEMRRNDLQIPTIMLTAKSEESDVLLGLGLGADDYIKKPFSIRELLARSEALLRRVGKSTEAKEQIKFGEFTLDLAARELRDADGPVTLSPKEYDLLTYLVTNPGRALSRDQIMASVWGYDRVVTPRSIDRFVTTLRKKIEPNSSKPRHILTIREFGYKFEF